MAAKVHNELFEIPSEERDQDEIQDGYQLKFIGKSYAKLQADQETETVITPDFEHNSKAQNTNSENIFITGDNLDALKHLQKAYSSKVDVIYIDPPYNTGSDGFVYADNFKFSDDDLKEKLNLTEEEISRVRALSGKSSHSAWLTFMLPRLMIAKQLLNDTGIIFISIDDNEQAQLKQICDEVFGSNFLNTICWYYENSTLKNPTGKLASTHEYILAFSKTNKPNLNQIRFGQISENLIKRFGKIADSNLNITLKSARKAGEESYLSRMIPKFKKAHGREPKEDDIIDTLQPNYLRDVFEIPTMRSNDFKSRFNIPFQNPKNPELIKLIIRLTDTKNKDSLILDFFAGSGTTADAVMQLNKEDGGNRKYILVQLPEKVSKNSEAEKAGYKTIDQISRERIIRAAAKIGDESGFKHFRLTEPENENLLIKMEEFDPEANVAFPEDMTTIFDGGKETILQTWLIEDGFEFNQKPEIIEFAGYKAYYIKNRLYLIETGWSSEATRELLNKIGKNQLEVQTIVIFPYSFSFNELNELKINLRTAFEKANKVQVLERY